MFRDFNIHEKGLVLYLTGIVVSFIVIYVVYQTKLHPLSGYPGPILAKLTRLEAVLHAWRGTRHSQLYSLHQKYGPIIRCGPNHISINRVEALEPIYGAKANVQKSDWYSAMHSITIFNARDKQVHARKKRVMSSALSDQVLRSVQPAMKDIIHDWCAALTDCNSLSEASKKNKWSAPKDMSKWCPYLIFDCLGQLLYSKPFGTVRRSDDRPFIDLISKNVWFDNVVGQLPALKRSKLFAILTRGQKKKLASRLAFSRQVLDSRLSKTPTSPSQDRESPKDILQALQQAKDPETDKGYTETELISEINLLLPTGSDTTNTALASAFYFLAQHPTILTRLTASVRADFSSLDDITYTALNSNPYFKACVDESLRLCPPVPMLLPREVCAAGLNVMGHHFPASTIIGVPTYTLHHHPAYFHDPFRYDPDRWLTGDSDAIATQRRAFIPFSTGPRSCLGRGVAFMELSVALAHVLFLYDIRIQPGNEGVGMGPEGEYRIKDYVVVGKEGPVLQFRPRATEAAGE